MDWNDLRHFLALARTGSVRAAGSALGVSHSTVLRRVEALEEELGTRLFDRSRGGFALTQAGQDMLPGAERVDAEMGAIERGVLGRDDQLEGKISITCGDAWVADLVLAVLQPFCAQHPGIALHVGVDDRLFDLSRREADIGIRALPVSKQPPQHLIGTRIAPMHMCSYVAVAHAERLDPERADSEARWAAFDDPDVQRNLASTTPYSHLEIWGGFSSLAVLVSALKYGYGVGLLPCYVGDVEPELRRLPTPQLPHLGDLWLLSHPDLRTNARLRACRRAITEGFERHLWRFDGSGRPPTQGVQESDRP
ncbi:MAG: LysR family transcriptional regulator [Myxococcales bacterium]|nr:LysR family transcriptional regulator [Myxococcales bacterium]